jgi:hypothetical protein
VNAEFNVWLLIVGLVVGAGLAWLVMMDGRRRDAEIDATELPREAAWLSAVMAEDGYEVSPDAAEQLLLLHRAYLGAPPPDPIDEGDRFEDKQTAEGEAPGVEPPEAIEAREMPPDHGEPRNHCERRDEPRDDEADSSAVERDRDRTRP